ncbi:hypothetical protein PILCRDRAFT_526436 [Piloderma croceum F 1598]|uniref:Uncharacterized protein n=1 Tax=Piloderma croceum (strain F 1598) TaxID=765440 RepID=A0A0C3B2X5_PILCF|nr:hypothetical protein PILCRDRAFT_526436 [Piloderma croceum F 1598]
MTLSTSQPLVPRGIRPVTLYRRARHQRRHQAHWVTRRTTLPRLCIKITSASLNYLSCIDMHNLGSIRYTVPVQQFSFISWSPLRHLQNDVVARVLDPDDICTCRSYTLAACKLHERFSL